MCVECIGYGAAMAAWAGHFYRIHIKNAYYWLLRRRRTA